LEEVEPKPPPPPFAVKVVIPEPEKEEVPPEKPLDELGVLVAIKLIEPPLPTVTVYVVAEDSVSTLLAKPPPPPPDALPSEPEAPPPLPPPPTTETRYVPVTGGVNVVLEVKSRAFAKPLPAAAAAALVQVVPLDVSTLPLVPGATT
jgi:hypothetical protein